MIGTIWQRYVFKNLIKGFLFFLFSFFLLYSLIDFSTHAQDFISKGSLNIDKLALYYSHQLLKRFDLLLPLALLISIIRVLTGLNANRELVALQASGLPLKKILGPFFLLAVFCSFLGYCNEDFFLPASNSRSINVCDLKNKKGHASKSRKQFTMRTLSDSSKLIYQSFDEEKNAFFDVYWVRSFEDIWRMKYLSADPNNPTGEYIDHMVRNGDGFLENVESFTQKTLPFLKWTPNDLSKKQASIKHQRITKLGTLLLKPTEGSSLIRREVQTHFFRKLAMPLLPFLVLIAVVPFCITYSRNPALFMIYGLAIFSFVVFFTLIDAMTIISENRVIPPYIAIFSPFALCLGLTYKKFHKLL